MTRKATLTRKPTTAGAQHLRPARLMLEVLEPRLVLEAGPLLITEFMADNETIRYDADNDYSDWIEIHNPTQTSIDLNGWFLTDDEDDLTKWRFPAVTMEPNTYRVVFASGKDRTDPAELHTNFRLSSGGEYLALVQDDGRTISHEYAPEFPSQSADVSFGLTKESETLLDSGARLTYLVPTVDDAGLGTTWAEMDFDNAGWHGAEPPPPLQITEAGTGDDFVEIQNVSGEVLDTSGWVVAVNNASGRTPDINNMNTLLWHLPDSMERDEVLYRHDNDEDPEHAWGENIFFRTAAVGWVVIADDGGKIVDFVVWGYTPAELASFAVTVNGFDVTADGVWLNESVPSAGADTPSLQRHGDSDHDSADDWSFVPVTSMGLENDEITIPFPSGPTTGVGFSTQPNAFGNLVQTDVGAVMQNVNSSIWMRIPFEVEDLTHFDGLNLWMRYADGFVAYLNGQEVARRNAPDSVAWDSAATDDRSIQEAVLYEDVDITDRLGLLQPGTNVLAIHGLNSATTDGDLLILPRLVASSDEDVMSYMAQPSPWQPNENATTAAGPQFSHPGGTFVESFGLVLSSTDFPTAVIRYTTNGTLPDENSTVYTSPIPINGSTQVRALLYEEDGSPSPVVTETYIQIAPDVLNFTSELPLVVIDTLGRSIPAKSSLYKGAAYMAIFEPGDHDDNPFTNDRATLISLADVDTRIGIKERGSSSSGWPKHHYRIESWNEVSGFMETYDDMKLNDKEISPLGMPDESDWILGSYYRFDKALMRNAFIYELSNQVGRYATRTEHVEVFLNTGTGPLSYSDYFGVYSFMENIKADRDRVDIDRLGSNDNAEPNVTGGYIFKDDREASVPCGGNDGFSAGGMSLVYDEPDACEITAAQKSWLTGYLNSAYAALPGSNYTQYIDVDAFIDHHWLNLLTKNPDAFRLSGYYFKDRSGPIEAGPIWDFDRTMGCDNDSRALTPTGWNPSSPPSDFWTYGWWSRLFAHSDFAQQWIDRWFVLKERGMNVPNSMAIIDEMTEEITEEAAGRNNAKWSSEAPSGGWMSEVNQLKSWLTQRINWIDAQFLKPVTFNQNGGPIDAGFQLTMSTLTGGVYYTTDGSDPRASGGGISGSARLYTGPITLNDTTRIRARAWNNRPLTVNSSGPSGGWGPPVEADFFLGEAASAENLVISELNYDPYDPTADESAAGFIENNDFEFLELHNVGDAPVYLGGARFTNGIDFDFVNSSIQILDPGEYVVVAQDQDALQARYGTEIPLAGEFDDGRLANGGEQITLLDYLDQPIVDFGYDNGGDWPEEANGPGATLELIDPAAVPHTEPQRTAYLEDAGHWRYSSEYGGTPGSAGAGPLNTVVINEVLAHTDIPWSDSIELHNLTGAWIDLSGWYVSDAGSSLQKFRIPDGTGIDAGGYIVFDEDDFNPTPMNPGPNDFALNGAHGDDVWLTMPDGSGTLTHFVDHVEFPASGNGESFGRWPNGTGDLVPMDELTLNPANGENSVPRVGPIILSEVHYNPGNFAGANDLEFVEIYNPTDETVDLTNWRIRKGIDFNFADGTLLSAVSALIVAPFHPSDTDRLAAFRAYYGIDEKAVQIVGGYSRLLDNGGESIQLQRPDAPPPDEPDYIPYLIEDEVAYDDDGSWPIEADGNGHSLNRSAINAWGNDNLNWSAYAPTPGLAPLLNAAGIVGRHVFYNSSKYDGFNPAANALDAAAVAPDKQPLMPGETATFANYTSYSEGINGILIDVTDLPDQGTLDAGDFQFRAGNDDDPSNWAVAESPDLIAVSSGGGVGGSDRITLIWSDHAVRNQWLQVTVMANGDTGLPEDDVFYIGNAAGETGNSTGDAKVTADDLLLARNNPRNFLTAAPIDFRYDFNRDARVNATDLLVARNNQTHALSALTLITPPVAKSAGGGDSQTAISLAQDVAAATWLYEFEQAADSKRTDAVTDDAVDELLANSWL